VRVLSGLTDFLFSSVLLTLVLFVDVGQVLSVLQRIASLVLNLLVQRTVSGHVFLSNLQRFCRGCQFVRCKRAQVLLFGLRTALLLLLVHSLGLVVPV